MKNFKIYLACLTVVGMLFSSCSKEENSALADNPSNKGTLTFGAFLNDLMLNKAALKQSAVSDLPTCSDDVPSYVEIVLSQGGEPVVGTLADPLKVEVNPTPQDYDDDGEVEYFTKESLSLELSPGTYTLEYFTVYSDSDEVIWVAPINDGEGALYAFVTNPLPMDISLGAGVKKYVDVEVLCFDDRDVNEYGYQFFDIDENEAFEFCFFANYCNSGGRHFPAALSVDIWLGTDGTGLALHSNLTNEVGVNDDGDFFAIPICFALPNLDEFEDDEDYIYYEVTLLDWDGAYGDVDQVIKSGTLSRNDVTANFDGDDNVDYEHLRFGCDDDPISEDCPGDDDCDGIPNDDDVCPGQDDNADADGDQIPDGCDECPNDATDTCNDEDYDPIEGCETAFAKGDTSFFDMNFKNNRWGWAENWNPGDGDLVLPFWAGAGQNDTSNGTQVGEVSINVNGSVVHFEIDMFNGNNLETAHIYLDGDEPTNNAPGQYTYQIDGDNLSYSLDVEDFNVDGSFWIIVHGDVCGDDVE